MSNRSEPEMIQNEFSDSFKSFYGFRPHHVNDEDWNDIDWLKSAIQEIWDHIDNMKSTFAGREELREQGWIIEETDPEMAKWAAWLKAERDRYYNEREVA